MAAGGEGQPGQEGSLVGQRQAALHQARDNLVSQLERELAASKSLNAGYEARYMLSFLAYPSAYQLFTCVWLLDNIATSRLKLTSSMAAKCPNALQFQHISKRGPSTCSPKQKIQWRLVVILNGHFRS